jgi:transcription initiation factor TFIIB
VKGVKCPECGCERIVHDPCTGEVVCAGCGLVIEAPIIDARPEWRSYTAEESAEKSRVGMPSLLSIHDKSLTTTIGRVDEDASGRKLSKATQQQMWRLRRLQIRSRAYGSAERNLAQAMAELNRLCEALKTPPSIRENAAAIYRKVLEMNMVRGRTINAMVAGALYAACRSAGLQRTTREIAKAVKAERRTFLRCYKAILKELNVQTLVPDPISYISRIAEPLKVGGEAQGRAVQIIMKAREKRETVGKKPIGLAAAALYLACQELGIMLLQRDVAGAAGVTEVTIRNHSRSLERCLGLKPHKRWKARTLTSR